jgi:CRP-like cAMP-binding protein
MTNRKYDFSEFNQELLEAIRDPNLPGNAGITLIDELTPLGQQLSFSIGDRVLKTGDLNDSLYFLIEGEIAIVVGQETVATLKRKGDIIGEMSIISKNLCSADVVATTPTIMLKVKVDELKEKSSDYELLLYKIFCLTLTEKLENTNVKAHKFEVLNRSLEEEVQRRTNELKLGYKKLENMYAENILMVNKLSTLDEDYIQSSLKLLDQATEQGSKLDALKINLKLIQKSLSPMKELKSQQEQLKDQRVLVVESNPKQRNMIKIALGGTGVKVDMVKTAEEAQEALKSNACDILFLSAEMLEVADFVKEHNIKTKIVLMTEEESKEYISKIKQYHFISNIVATKEDDRAFNIKSISTTVSKMTTGDIFGLEKYLNWGIEVKEFAVTNSKERQDINDQVISHLTELGIRSVVRTRCQIVIEELLMNAIYDAPVDKNGTPLHNFKARTEAIVLTPDQSGKLRFATDGLYLAISVEDPFGVFKKDTIFKYLETNYFADEGKEVIHEGKGGAGKGLFMITESADLVIYNVSPRSKTEVIVLFDLDPSKEKKSTSLHYFEL